MRMNVQLKHKEKIVWNVEKEKKMLLKEEKQNVLDLYVPKKGLSAEELYRKLKYKPKIEKKIISKLRKVDVNKLKIKETKKPQKKVAGSIKFNYDIFK